MHHLLSSSIFLLSTHFSTIIPSPAVLFLLTAAASLQLMSAFFCSTFFSQSHSHLFSACPIIRLFFILSFLFLFVVSLFSLLYVALFFFLSGCLLMLMCCHFFLVCCAVVYLHCYVLSFVFFALLFFFFLLCLLVLLCPFSFPIYCPAVFYLNFFPVCSLALPLSFSLLTHYYLKIKNLRCFLLFLLDY